MIHEIPCPEREAPLSSPFSFSPPTTPDRVFKNLYRESGNSFWLDSSTAADVPDFNDDEQAGGGETSTSSAAHSSYSSSSSCPIRSSSRFSMMGDDAGPLCRRVEYYGAEHPAEDRGLRIFSRRKPRRGGDDVEEDEEEEEEEEAL